MLLESEAVLVIKLGDLSESIADGLQQGHVLADTAPDTDAVMLVSDREHNAIYHTSLLLRELATNEVQDELEPCVLAVFLKVILDGHSDDPLAAMLVLRVLPFGANALLKKQIVGVRNYLRHSVQVVIHVPKVLNLQSQERTHG